MIYKRYPSPRLLRKINFKRSFFVLNQCSELRLHIGTLVINIVYEAKTRRNLAAKHHIVIKTIQFSWTNSFCHWRPMQLFEEFLSCDLRIQFIVESVDQGF